MRYYTVNYWKKYKSYFKWLLALVCCAYIIYFFTKNKNAFEQLFSLDPLFLAWLFLFCALTIVIQAWRYLIVIEKCGQTKLPFLKWFKIFILGTFLSRIFPQTGNIFRAVRLKQDFGISYTGYVSIYTSFVWLDTILNLSIAFVVISFLKPGFLIGPIRVLYLISCLLALIVTAPWFLMKASAALKTRFTSFQWLHSRASEVLKISIQSIKDIAYIGKVAITGIASFSITLSVFYICFASLDTPVEITTLALFAVILKLSNLVILTPGNIGVRELAYGLLGELTGIGLAQALLVSVITRIVISCLILGLGFAAGGLDLLTHRSKYNRVDT
ncbi:MAG: hypothetical protein DRP56_04675 [Planctomycetota bacterium]|nr:MAG: hypothetical protein DRP56_04675 [Planctomycetota bacterium]